MKIRLDLIKSSKNSIRTSFDREKIIELSKSIQEQGVIVPIKVRPIEKGYFEVIYGHRHVEAAKMAGLCEIEAIEEGMDDTHSLVQGLVENVVRENMSPIETAKALKQLKEVTNWSNMDVERHGIMSNVRVSQLLSLLETPEDVQGLLVNSLSGDIPEGKITEYHVRAVRQILGDTSNGVRGPDKSDINSNESRSATVNKSDLLLASNNTTLTDIIKKAAKEGLTVPQTRQVAEEVKEASKWGGQKAVQQVISRPFEPSHKDYTSYAPKKEQIPEGSSEFSWFKEEHVETMNRAIEDIKVCINILLGTKEQRPVAKYILKMLLASFASMSKYIMDELKKKNETLDDAKENVK